MGGIGYETNKNKSQDLEFEEKERVKTLEACGEIETFAHCWQEWNLLQPLWETEQKFLKN